VIENHLGFQPVAALRLFAEFDQATVSSNEYVLLRAA